VQSNFGRFRGCYERGLAKNPNLEGRVAVRFVIGLDGTVTRSELAEADLPDPQVRACLVNAYTSLVFPRPEGGLVTVVYPIVFSPI
jgi:hypothetical protein